MSKWTLTVLLALIVAIGGGGVAGAKGKRKRHCHFDASGFLAQIKVISGSPPANGSELDAGVVDGTLCSKPFHGAFRQVTTFPQAGKLHSTGVVFGPLGSLSSVADGTGSANPNGSVAYSGSAKITGGSGAYKGASGSYKFTGQLASLSATTATIHVVGTVSY